MGKDPSGRGLSDHPSDDDPSPSGLETLIPPDNFKDSVPSPALGQTIPQYRLVNFRHFTNYFTNEDERYAIDAFVSKPFLSDHLEDVTRERKRRRQTSGSQQPNARERSLHLGQPQTTVEDSSEIPINGIIQRVRIKSRPVLKYLLMYADRPVTSRVSLTFIRPFQLFIQFQGRMKEALMALEAKWGNSVKAQSSENFASSTTFMSTEEKAGSNFENQKRIQDDTRPRTVVHDQHGDDDYESGMEEIGETIEALQHLRCYVGFVDEHIMPLIHRYQDQTITRIRFDDLWLLFRPGEDIFVKSATCELDGQQRSKSARYEAPSQRIWRVYCGVAPPVDFPSMDTFSERDYFNVHCFYLDFDGTGWQPVFTKLSIVPFRDEVDITSLPWYPVRYHANSVQMLQDSAVIGRKFHNAVEDKHFYYSGISLDRAPDGSYPENTKRQSGLLIESEVVVDFEETYLQAPQLRPIFTALRDVPIEARWRLAQSVIPAGIAVWNNAETFTILTDATIVEHGADVVSAKAWISRTSNTTWHVPRAKTDNGRYNETNAEETPTIRDQEAKIPVLREEHLVLAPTRVCCYAFKPKRFLMLDLRKLQPITRQTSVFKSLKIPKEYKEMVRGLVSAHFEKKRIDKCLAERFESSIGQDIIQGKGKGLVILLHGVPGVGKTATAEAVASENQKPLLTVTYGDLGTSSSKLEEKLEGLFHLATRWDCVLLFDEADVFLAERSRTELKRNALVSVFLRVLEYYHGILFLTTNRVGSIDDAFKSRLHMMLYYPPLGRAQTIAIFKANIAKLKEIEKQKQLVVDTPPLQINEDSVLRFAERHYDNGLPEGERWNGRQIKNAFQIAASLAHHRARTQEETQAGVDGLEGSKNASTVPVLDETHFTKVEQATRDFGQYITQTRGFTDAKWAKMSLLRNDEYSSHAQSGHSAAARNSPAPHPHHAVGGHGGYEPRYMADSFQPHGSLQPEGNSYPYRERSHQRGQASYEDYDAGGGHFHGGRPSQPSFHDPYRYHDSDQMARGTMPSRSPAPSIASPHAQGFRPGPGREDFGMPPQAGRDYEQFSGKPRAGVQDDDGEDTYN
ncbi:hypothetical protein B0T20DRAFT_389424 [Sordaria brevicollis]|uniref:AAA+ ATPase domain-containing protein n=1 Tax=Sordaria brevicollis TaxID=83679 RepID=A0AAE0UF30_SORBR|nr:hypothetical protein B0T20DRAFT_389424 [Sordaria brevicollis]